MSKVSKQKKSGGALGDVATSLEQELGRFETLVELSRTLELGTEKQIERAARSMGEAIECQQRIGGLVGQLVSAIEDARIKQERGIATLSARATQMKERRDLLEALLRRYGELGMEGAQVNALVVAASSSRAERPAEAVAGVKEAVERLGTLTDRAGELSKEAGEVGFTDLAHQVDGLRQQVAAARNKLMLVERSMANESGAS